MSTAKAAAPNGARGIPNGEFASLAGEVIGRGAAVRFRARGTSMAPLINDRDVVVVAPAPAPPRRGDVVLARAAGGSVVLHRTVTAREGFVITRGDACRADDAPVPVSAILGRVVAVPGRGRNLHLGFPFRNLLATKHRFAAALARVGLRRLLGRAVRALA